MFTIIRIQTILAGILLCLPMLLAAAPLNENFDHFTTGFTLTGGHRAVECDACHNSGNFRGTSRDCATCHSALMNTGAVVKNGMHIQSSNECESCHSTLAWDDVRRVNHMSVLGNCVSCHNGITATGVPNPGHGSGMDCIACHRTSSWLAVHFNHTANIQGRNCIECHSQTPAVNAIPATPHPLNPLHNTPNIDTGVVPCDRCHNTHNWIFGHNGTAGLCGTCHADAAYAAFLTQKPGADGLHNLITQQCDACHNTSAWKPAPYNHNPAGNYPTGHRSASCSACHTGGYVASPYIYPYGTTCAACHEPEYKSGHGSIPVPVNRQDCTGSGCHGYRSW